MVGILGAILCLVGWFTAERQFFQSWLFAFIFWVEPALGCLGFLMLHHLVGGHWGRAVRRFLEAGSLTLPLLALFFLPVAFGLFELYPWAGPHALEEELLRHKRPYLNPPFFYIRTALYFLIWVGLAVGLARWSSAEAARMLSRPDAAEDARRRLRVLSAPGVILFAFAANFAAYDWTMSLEPEWYSTMYGFLFLAHQAPVTLALLIMAAVILGDKVFLARYLDPSRMADLGGLLLAFIIIWMYASFFQYMLIWFGNLPEEISWYVRRNAGAWRWIAWFFVLFHFVLPFGILLFRANRSSPTTLAWLGAGLTVVHLVYVFWFVVPSFHPEGFHVHWLDAAAWMSMGGFWLWWFLRMFAGRPVFPPLGKSHG
jgi:hypothetical protein